MSWEDDLRTSMRGRGLAYRLGDPGLRTVRKPSERDVDEEGRAEPKVSFVEVEFVADGAAGEFTDEFSLEFTSATGTEEIQVPWEPEAGSRSYLTPRPLVARIVRVFRPEYESEEIEGVTLPTNFRMGITSGGTGRSIFIREPGGLEFGVRYVAVVMIAIPPPPTL